MEKKSALLFDFDGTLADTFQLENKSMVRTVNDFGHNEIDEVNIFDHYGPTEPGIVRDIVGEEEYPEALSYFLKTYTEIQKTCLKENPELTALLKELSEKPNLLLLVVTGRSRETLEISLDYLGYNAYFAKAYTGSMGGINKDQSVEQVLLDYGLEKKDVVYIGDSIADCHTMSKADVDLITAGYYHDEDYVRKLEELNPGNVVKSVSELRQKILEVIR